MVGFTGKFVKKMSAYSPWTLIGILTGFLVFAISLPVMLNNKKSSDSDKDTKKHDTEGENSSQAKKDPKSPQLRERKSKRID
jgi:hypothetical protein